MSQDKVVQFPLKEEPTEDCRHVQKMPYEFETVSVGDAGAVLIRLKTVICLDCGTRLESEDL